jgi:AcrR family transcriptional regulator
VGLTVSALYYHHENKEAVLQALLDRSIERVTELCSAALADAGDDPQARFCNLVECLVLFMTMSTRTAHLDHEMRSLPAESLRVYSTKRRRIESMMVQAVEAGVSANVFEVARPNRAGRALLGMVQSIASWYHPDGPVSPQELAHDYVNIALHTVGARAEVIAGVLSSG